MAMKSTEPLDEVDRAILACLQDDARMSMTTLARRVGLSAPSVTERVRRLEAAGVIEGYRTRIDPAALGLPVLAFVRLRPGPGQLARFAGYVGGIPAVSECHRITGEDCFLLKVHAPTVADLTHLLDGFQVYGTSVTSIVVSSPIAPRGPFPAID